MVSGPGWRPSRTKALSSDTVRPNPGTVLARRPLCGLHVRRNRKERNLRSTVPQRIGSKMAGLDRRWHSAALAPGRQGTLLSLLRFENDGGRCDDYTGV